MGLTWIGGLLLVQPRRQPAPKNAEAQTRTRPSRLRLRRVEVLRTTRTEVVVGSGLAEGERICLTTLSAVTDGMQVRVADEGV